MNIGIFGVTGTIGSRIFNEALHRGHKVTAYVRDASRIPPDMTGAKWKVADVQNPNAVAEVIGGQDVVISAISQGKGGDPQLIVSATRSLLVACGRRPGLRLLAVGGAGSLEVAPGKTVIDAGMIPKEWIAIPIAHRDALELYKANTVVPWTNFSPAASIQPGQRTGKFRLDNDRLVVGADGKSAISCEDYALAMLDEVEHPLHIRKRFTIGY
jgi:putative NADH-flavin reductase